MGPNRDGGGFLSDGIASTATSEPNKVFDYSVQLTNQGQVALIGEEPRLGALDVRG